MKSPSFPGWKVRWLRFCASNSLGRFGTRSAKVEAVGSLVLGGFMLVLGWKIGPLMLTYPWGWPLLLCLLPLGTWSLCVALLSFRRAFERLATPQEAAELAAVLQRTAPSATPPVISPGKVSKQEWERRIALAKAEQAQAAAEAESQRASLEEETVPARAPHPSRRL